MKIRVRAELVYRFDPPTDAIYKIQVAHWPGQDILEERLTITPTQDLHEDEDTEFGARTLRARLCARPVPLAMPLARAPLAAHLTRRGCRCCCWAAAERSKHGP